MGNLSKTARASTRGKRVEEAKHYNRKGEVVERVLLVSNKTKRFVWMNEAGDFFSNKEVAVRHNE